VSVGDHEAIVWVVADMRELNWGSSFVDYKPTHSWWFARKSVRDVCNRLTSCLVLIAEDTVAIVSIIINFLRADLTRTD
jgi:hypothetical protein